jgi:hypothetical protein
MRIDIQKIGRGEAAPAFGVADQVVAAAVDLAGDVGRLRALVPGEDRFAEARIGQVVDAADTAPRRVLVDRGVGERQGSKVEDRTTRSERRVARQGAVLEVESTDVPDGAAVAPRRRVAVQRAPVQGEDPLVLDGAAGAARGAAPCDDAAQEDEVTAVEDRAPQRCQAAFDRQVGKGRANPGEHGEDAARAARVDNRVGCADTGDLYIAVEDELPCGQRDRLPSEGFSENDSIAREGVTNRLPERSRAVVPGAGHGEGVSLRSRHRGRQRHHEDRAEQHSSRTRTKSSRWHPSTRHRRPPG